MPSGSRPLGTRLLDDDGIGSGAAASGSATGASDGQQDGQVAAVQQQVDRVRTVMQDNVNVMVENMEKGSNLEARSADLASQAQDPE